MNKKFAIVIVTVPLIVGIVAGSVLFSKDEVVSAQSQVIEAADKATKNSIEYIKVTTFGDSSQEVYSLHIRDRQNLTEISEDYVNGVLQSKIVITEKGHKVTSIGRDNATGKMTGSTWTLPENIAKENERVLKLSLLEEQKNQVKDQQWVEDRNTNEQKNLKEAVSEQTNKREVLTIDTSTGNPVTKKTYTKNENGSWNENPIRIEEYKFLDSMPLNKMQIDEPVDIKERPAPIIDDKLYEG